MGTQAAFRTEFDIEEEDRFFLSGVEKAGRLRNTYEHQLRKRRVLVGLAIGVGSLALVGLIIGLAWGLSKRKLEYACPRTYDPSKTDLVFFVIGDWGRSGNDNQEKVARLMSDVSECMPPKFVISTGDNFYPNGLSSANDSQFADSFSKVYTAPNLQVKWYAVMGNHDYGDSISRDLLESGVCVRAPNSTDDCINKCCISPWWQTSPALTAKDWRWNASLGGVVTERFKNLDIIFVDTVPIIYQYAGREWSNFLYGFNDQDSDEIQKQLNASLHASYNSGTKWRLVVGHHPVRSYGKHCTQKDGFDCSDMAFVRPWLQKYRVAAYINGHEHDQQLIKAPDDPVYYVTSGAGSDTREGEFDTLDPDSRSQDALFLSDEQGFLAVVMSGDVMRLHFYTSGLSGPTYTRVVNAPNW